MAIVIKMWIKYFLEENILNVIGHNKERFDVANKKLLYLPLE